MNKIITICILLLLSVSTHLDAQSRIKMQKEGGVYTVPCEVNGLKLRFILDTGASRVCISSVEAVFMLKNGYLDIDDIQGSSKAQIADGSIIEGTEIILREIKIGNKTLNNIKATVIKSEFAPLLLGQSAIQQLGTIKLDGDELIIVPPRQKSKKTGSSTGTTRTSTQKKTPNSVNMESKTSDNRSNNKQANKKEAKEWLDEGSKYYNNKRFDKAVTAYTKAYNLDKSVINAVQYIFFAISCKEIEDFDNAIFMYECAKKELEENKSLYVREYGQKYWIDMLYIAYVTQMQLYLDREDNDLVISTSNEILSILNKNIAVTGKSKIYLLVAHSYIKKKDYKKGLEMLDLSLDNILVENYNGRTLIELERKDIKDEDIGGILRLMAICYNTIDDGSNYRAYLKKAVAFGDTSAKVKLNEISSNSRSEERSKSTAKQTQSNGRYKKYKVGNLNFNIPNYSEWDIDHKIERGASLFSARKTNGIPALFMIISVDGDISPDTLSDLLFSLVKKELKDINIGQKVNGIMGGSRIPLSSKTDKNVVGNIDTFSKYGQSYIMMSVFDKKHDPNNMRIIYDSIRF